jgi:hypothetical protein
MKRRKTFFYFSDVFPLLDSSKCGCKKKKKKKEQVREDPKLPNMIYVSQKSLSLDTFSGFRKLKTTENPLLFNTDRD